MTSETRWEYWPNTDLFNKTGKYYLYRNSIYLADDNREYYLYSTLTLNDENKDIHITKTEPVASGITAFFAGGLGFDFCLYQKLRDNQAYITLDFFKVYLKNVSKWTSIENDKLPNPKPPEEVWYNFLESHIIDEKECLKDSEKYYSENRNEDDKNIKSRIREYTLSYIEWIEEKFESLAHKLNVSTPPLHKLVKFNLINNNQISPPEIASFEPFDYINSIEQILQFIQHRYLDQLHCLPDTIYRPIPKSLSEKEFEYIYNIHIDGEFFNVVKFRKEIRKLLVDKNIDNESLIRILKECYELSKINSETFEKSIKVKQFDIHHEIFFGFSNDTGVVNYYKEPADNVYFTKYSNSDFGYFSSQIFGYLEKEIFTDQAKNSISEDSQNNSKPAVLEDVPQNKKSTIYDTATTSINSKPVTDKSAYNSHSDSLPDLLNGSDTKYINAIESILDSISAFFQYQVNPQNYFHFIQFLGIKKDEKVLFFYIIENGDQIIDFSTFKIWVMQLLLSNDIDKTSLKILLNKSYTTAISNIDLFKEHLESRESEDTLSVLLKFDLFKLKLTIQGSKTQFLSPKAFTNGNLAYYSAQIADFLEHTLSFGTVKLNINDVFNNENLLSTNKTHQSLINNSISKYDASDNTFTISNIFSYLEKIESFLNFIQLMFSIQVNPDSQYPTSAELKLYEVKNSQFDYFIEDKDNLLDFRPFRSRIRILASDKGRDIQQLKISLQHSYSLAENIIKLFEYNLTSISPGKIISIRAYINSIPVGFGLEQDFTHEKFIHLDNFDLLLISRYVHAVLGFEIYNTSETSNYLHSVPIFFQPILQDVNIDLKTEPAKPDLPVHNQLNQLQIPEGKVPVSINSDSFSIISEKQSLSEELSQILFPLYPDNIKDRIIDLNFKIYLTNLFLHYIDSDVNDKPTKNGQYIIYDNKTFYHIITQVLYKYCINPNRIKKDISDMLKNVTEKTVGNNLPPWKQIKTTHRENTDKNRENRENREK